MYKPHYTPRTRLTTVISLVGYSPTTGVPNMESADCPQCGQRNDAEYTGPNGSLVITRSCEHFSSLVNAGYDRNSFRYQVGFMFYFTPTQENPNE